MHIEEILQFNSEHIEVEQTDQIRTTVFAPNLLNRGFIHSIFVLLLLLLLSVVLVKVHNFDSRAQTNDFSTVALLFFLVERVDTHDIFVN